MNTLLDNIRAFKKDSITIVVSGDRNWTDYDTIFRVLSALKSTNIKITILEGECKGVDKLCKKAALSLGMNVKPYPADWGEPYDPSAGPIRNRKMLDQKPDLILAFHPNLKASKGTKDLVIEALDRNLEVWQIIDNNFDRIQLLRQEL